jgi:hypothetical protein
MAKDFIKIDVTLAGATQAGLLRAYIQTLRTAYETGLRVRAIMTHNNDGTDFTPIETLFGLPGGLGYGQVVFDLVNGSVGGMEGVFQTPDAKNITEKVG